MTRYIYILLTVFICSCNPMLLQKIPGEYLSRVKDSKTSITFNEDGSFIFQQNNLGIVRRCQGKWELKSNDIVCIKCNDTSDDISAVLSSGYIESFEKEIRLINANKIKMEGMVLKRKK